MLVVGPNLSIDQTVLVPRLRVGEIHRVPEIVRLAGGKGTNVARAARILGAEPLLVGFVGGPLGDAFAAYLAADGIASELVRTAGETRVCFSIADEATGQQTEFYEAGAPVSAAECARLLAMATARVAGRRWMVVTGSLPRGAPDDLSARLVELAHAPGARALLDARGAALAEGVAARPDVIKINRGELAELAGAPIASVAEVARAAAGCSVAPGGAVMVTDGAAGALLVAEAGAWRVTPPPVAARSPVGSGDCAAAAIVAALEREEDYLAAMRWGVAAGTANTLRAGAARFTRAEAERVLAGCVTMRLGAA
ncbi:MAG TPA: 1-phosphofructokinase family hexose kinase [Ktedonobacterales bacterium]|nr:1-phosphofructokinase family hexose kinase [Ktedonobacterales bacterium]